MARSLAFALIGATSGCGGPGQDVWPDGEPEQVRVSGTLTITDRPYGPAGFDGSRRAAPGRGAVVELVRSDDGAVLATGITDELGSWSLEAQAPHGGWYVRAVSELAGARLHHAVVDRTTGAPALYAVRAVPPAMAGPGEGAAARPREVHMALRPEPDSPANAALHIVDTLWRADAFLASLIPERETSLDFVWRRGHAFDCGSCYTRSEVLLAGGIEDPDEYDDDIILHEFAHYFSHVWSRDQSPGGRHIGDPVDPRLAWGEGLATALSAIIRGEPDYVDFREAYVRYYDLSDLDEPRFRGTVNGAPDGAVSEYLVAHVLWRLFADSRDAVGETEAARPILEVLTTRLPDRARQDLGHPGIDLVDFLDELVCTQPPSAPALEDILTERAFPWAPHDASCGAAAQHKANAGAEPRFFRLHREGATVVLRHPLEFTREYEVRVQRRRGDATVEDRMIRCTSSTCVVDTTFSEDDGLIVTGAWDGHEPFGQSVIGAVHDELLQGSFREARRGSRTVREYASVTVPR